MPLMLTGTVAANTMPSNTVGWMSTPVVGVADSFVRHSSAPVVWSRASTPSEPASANTRPSATATPNGPMLKPVAALLQRMAPDDASMATTTPEAPCRYTVPSTTSGAVVNCDALGRSVANAVSSFSTFFRVIVLPIAALELSRFCPGFAHPGDAAALADGCATVAAGLADGVAAAVRLQTPTTTTAVVARARGIRTRRCRSVTTCVPPWTPAVPAEVPSLAWERAAPRLARRFPSPFPSPFPSAGAGFRANG